MANPHAPIFTDEDDGGVPWDEHPYETRFTSYDQFIEYRENWMGRAIVGERRLAWESLPIEITELVESVDWYGFVTDPDPSYEMNRSIVREFYAIVATTGNVTREFTWRGVHVQFTPRWINHYYLLEDIPRHVDFFRPFQWTERFYSNMVRHFGETHLWAPMIRRSGQHYPSRWTPEVVRTTILFLAYHLHGTVNHTEPPIEMYILAYAFLTNELIDVGQYIVERIGQIAMGNAGDGYIFFPFLITAFAREFRVPQYDTDNLSGPNEPILYE